MRNPKPVCRSSTHAATATSTAMTTPRCSWVPGTMIGSHEFGDSSRVCGIRPTTANDSVLSIIGPASR